MGLKLATSDEIGGTSGPLVEVPRPLLEKAANIVNVVLLAGVATLLAWGSLHLDVVRPLLGSYAAIWLCFLFFVTLEVLRRRLDLIWANYPNFAVGKEGIQLRDGNYDRLFDWREVSYCHWSHYEAGVLNIQTNGNPVGSGASSPPMRHFYRVPEAYRSRVEQAIRALGKWADGGSEPVLVQAASPATDSTKVHPAVRDEIDEPPVPLVEIPRPRWKIVVILLMGLLFLVYVAAIFLPPGEAARQDVAGRWGTSVCIGIGAIIGFLAVLAGARSPEFAVGKDGIRFVERLGRDAWPWNTLLRDFGLLAWDEACYCRWSFYEPGALTIQIKPRPSVSNVLAPPERLFYRVPEPYRPSVEGAIRAMGKWAE